MNFLITGAFHCTADDISRFQAGEQNTVYFQGRESDIGSIDPAIIDVVVCNWYFMYHDITKFTWLKGVQLLSAGLERIDLEYARKNKIHIWNARGVYSIPMAEYAVCGALQLYKQSNMTFRNQEKHPTPSIIFVVISLGFRFSIININSSTKNPHHSFRVASRNGPIIYFAYQCIIDYIVFSVSFTNSPCYNSIYCYHYYLPAGMCIN